MNRSSNRIKAQPLTDLIAQQHEHNQDFSSGIQTNSPVMLMRMNQTETTLNQTLTFLSVTLAWTHSHFSCRLCRSSSVVLSWPSGVMAKICCPRSRSCLCISSLASSVLQSSYKHTERHHVHRQPDICWLFKEFLLMFECKFIDQQKSVH